MKFNGRNICFVHIVLDALGRNCMMISHLHSHPSSTILLLVYKSCSAELDDCFVPGDLDCDQVAFLYTLNYLKRLSRQ